MTRLSVIACFFALSMSVLLPHSVRAQNTPEFDFVELSVDDSAELEHNQSTTAIKLAGVCQKERGENHPYHLFFYTCMLESHPVGQRLDELGQNWDFCCRVRRNCKPDSGNGEGAEVCTEAFCDCLDLVQTAQDLQSRYCRAKALEKTCSDVKPISERRAAELGSDVGFVSAFSGSLVLGTGGWILLGLLYLAGLGAAAYILVTFIHYKCLAAHRNSMNEAAQTDLPAMKSFSSRIAMTT